MYLNVVKTEMTAKGFVTSDNPEMLVDVFIKTQKKVDATGTTSGAGYGLSCIIDSYFQIEV